MTGGELAFLGMVVGAFAAFAVTLICVSITSR